MGALLPVLLLASVSVELGETQNLEARRLELGRAIQDAVAAQSRADAELVSEADKACKDAEACQQRLEASGHTALVVARAVAALTRIQLDVTVYTKGGPAKEAVVELPKEAPERWRSTIGAALAPLLPAQIDAKVLAPSARIEEGKGSQAGPLILLGVGAAAAAIGIGFAASYASTRSELLDAQYPTSEHDSLVSSANTAATTAVVALAAAGVALATGTSWALLF